MKNEFKINNQELFKSNPELMTSFPKIEKVYCKKVKNRFRVYFQWNKKQTFIDKTLDGRGLKTEEDVEYVVAYLKGSGYKPEEWKKEKSFNLTNSYDEWLKLMVVTPTYKYNRQLMKKKYVEHFGASKDIRQIDTMGIRKFHGYLKDLKLGSKTIKHYFTELKMFLTVFKDDIKKFPELPRIRVQKPPIKSLTLKEMGQIFEFIPKEDLPIFTLMKFTAIRLNEAGGLQKSDVDWQTRRFYIQHVLDQNGTVRDEIKTKKAKYFPIIPELEQALKSEGDSPFVFSKKEGKQLYTKKNLERIWDRANEQATKKYGTKRVSLYKVKHTFATLMYRVWGRDMVKDILGIDIQTLDRYADASRDDIGEVMRGMNQTADNSEEHKKIMPLHKESKNVSSGNNKEKSKEEWLRDQDLNLDSRSQSPLSYH
jgi:integrase